MFCLACITEHLTVNSPTCPECNDHLSADTLRRPRVVNNYLSGLKIKCDHGRGYSEFVRVADLETYVENCAFAPLLCSNEECGMEINKQDTVHHETEACEYRKVKSSDFRQIEEAVGKLEGNLKQLNEKVETIKLDQQQVKDKVNAVEQKVEAIKEDQQEIKQEVKDVKENISKVKKDVKEVKVMMRQMLEKINMLELLNKLPSPTDGIMNIPRGDILIAGGSGPLKNVKQSTEIYSWEKNGWFEMSEMNKERVGASSFIYKDQLFVVGGDDTTTIETLDLNELPLKWMEFPGEFPYEFADHQTVVYQQRVIHIGGYNFDEGKWSNVISEIQLSSPCTMKELCQMPESQELHGAEIFEEKVLIMARVNGLDDPLNSVLKFDVTKNEYTEMPPLPQVLSNMATVRWRDKVVVLGGINDDDKVLNDVFMYDCKTGKTTTLPSMLEKRCRCCAVNTGNTIVVMGGYDDDGEVLKSVECFTMGGCTWEYLPGMNNARFGAIAQVLPFTRKYL